MRRFEQRSISLPDCWWWSSEQYAREGMRETQRQRRELVAHGVSKFDARCLVPRIRLHRHTED